jgi:hypothetical protein
MTSPQCHALCDVIAVYLTPDCQQKAKASYTCGASATWACLMGGNFPVEQGGACNAENQAFAACQAGGDAGGG